MASANIGNIGSGQHEDLRGLRLIPLVIRYSAGAPSVVQNPTGEAVTLTDTGTGDCKITLGTAGLAPLFCYVEVLPTAAGTLGLLANLKTAPTSSVIEILVNSGADGATETDPVDLHVLIVKQVAA